MNIAVIGCGLMADRRIAAIRSCDRIVSVFDIDLNRARKAASTCNACSISDDVGIKNVDAVIVSTPTGHHEPYVTSATSAGKFVLLEKPGAVSSASCPTHENIRVGYTMRYNPGVIELRRYFAEDHSELLWIRATIGHGGYPDFYKSWRVKDANSGGEHLDQLPHLVDLVYYITGHYVDGSHIISGNKHWSSIADDVVLTGKVSCAPVVLFASYTQWEPSFTLEISTGDRYYTVNGGTPSWRPQLWGVMRNRSGRAGEWICRAEFGNSGKTVSQFAVENEWLAFVDAVEGRPSDIATPKEAYDVLRVIAP